jgi:DNA-binding CsgD family transcriptional regulator
MRFRDATIKDIPAVVATFDGFNALPLEPGIREALGPLLERMIASPACMVTVFEVPTQAGLAVRSFAGGAFLRSEVVGEYLAHPAPGLMSSVLAQLLAGRQPLLTLDEIRRLNSTVGLDLALFPIPLGRSSWSDPELDWIRKLAPQAFLRTIGGYRLRSIYYEVFADEVAAYLQAGGYRLLHDFSSHAGTGFIPADCRPRMLRLSADDLPPGAMSLASQMFNPPAARLGLTIAEQRVGLRSLDGASDRAIAETLGLSTETVRSSWRSIYRRLDHVLPDFAAPAAHGDETARGLEKRRVAIEYLRQNMHELRPSLTARRGSSTT